MANKRQLKKQIRYICGDIAAECALAKYIVDGINREAMNDALIKIADLQEETLSRVNVTFDKLPKDFESLKAYNKAKTEFTNKAFASINAEFSKDIQEIVKQMNNALPHKKD
ncbi:MAG: hypothetical protein K2H84_08585 [Paramuribaculum sp.]|nr:hypothetical protein [Paramuribaculum sp.]